MVLGLALLIAAQTGAAPAKLDESTFAAVRAYATPSKRDLAFQEIDWKTSVFEGLVEAQRQDKPLLLWMYFGDPRGRC